MVWGPDACLQAFITLFPNSSLLPPFQRDGVWGTIYISWARLGLKFEILLPQPTCWGVVHCQVALSLQWSQPVLFLDFCCNLGRGILLHLEKLLSLSHSSLPQSTYEYWPPEFLPESMLHLAFLLFYIFENFSGQGFSSSTCLFNVSAMDIPTLCLRSGFIFWNAFPCHLSAWV